MSKPDTTPTVGEVHVAFTQREVDAALRLLGWPPGDPRGERAARELLRGWARIGLERCAELTEAKLAGAAPSTTVEGK